MINVHCQIFLVWLMVHIRLTEGLLMDKQVGDNEAFQSLSRRKEKENRKIQKFKQ